MHVKIVEPGFVDTDFAGRSVGAFLAAQAQLGAGGDEPAVVAEVSYRAVTDGTDQLRCTAGPYAAELMANRAAADATFISGVKQQFGI